MAAYAVTGNPLPDCKTVDTGQPAGEYNGKDYWRWTVGSKTFYLWWNGVNSWIVNQSLGGGGPSWVLPAVHAEGTYSPILTASGTPVVTAISQFATLQISEGPYAGKYIVLKV